MTTIYPTRSRKDLKFVTIFISRNVRKSSDGSLAGNYQRVRSMAVHSRSLFNLMMFIHASVDVHAGRMAIMSLTYYSSYSLTSDTCYLTNC